MSCWAPLQTLHLFIDQVSEAAIRLLAPISNFL